MKVVSRIKQHNAKFLASILAALLRYPQNATRPLNSEGHGFSDKHAGFLLNKNTETWYEIEPPSQE